MTSKLTIVLDAELPLQTPATSPQPSPPTEQDMKGEELAKLWMNENAIVNQKAAYFTAVNAALGAALASQGKILQSLDHWICIAGAIVSLIAVFSIARTCAYRKHLRDMLNSSPGYQEALHVNFRWYEGVPSNVMLTYSPFLAIAGWLGVLYFRSG